MLIPGALHKFSSQQLVSHSVNSNGKLSGKALRIVPHVNSLQPAGGRHWNAEIVPAKIIETMQILGVNNRNESIAIRAWHVEHRAIGTLLNDIVIIQNNYVSCKNLGVSIPGVFMLCPILLKNTSQPVYFKINLASPCRSLIVLFTSNKTK